MSWRFLVLFLCVFLNGDFCDDALSHLDDNVCPTTVKELRNFKETYICKNKKICRRTKQKSVSVLKNICCLGWKKCNGKCIKESDVCASPECVNGIYKDKNCTCDHDFVHLNETHCGPKCSDGFYNDLTTTNYTCISKCGEPCVNGICTDFDTCTCNPGLVNFNETHCGPDCPKGFHNDITVDDLSCISDCSQPCVNGVCTDIETCTCDPGLVNLNLTHCGPKCSDGFYNDISSTNFTCISKCSEPCVNGNCTDFDTCTCNPGLVSLNKTHCGPDCPKGFHNDITKDDLSCISDCSQPCVNGICTDIETCTCDPGLVNLNLTHCGPKCSDGFYNDLSSTNFTCISKCTEPCVNGNCTDFDTCTCNPGLVHFNETHCGPDCPKGFHNDITKDDLSCISDCSQPCVNGICTDIETCTCDSGLVNLNLTHCGPKCSDGFYNDLSSTNFTCISKCTEPCVNGNCTDFDTCTCNPGLVNLNKTHCGPDCPKGFHNDITKDDLSCISDCSQPCVNGICTDIETCTCDYGLVNLNLTHCGPKCSDGFYNDLSSTNFTCISKCTEPCVNGNCTDFDTCTCNPGLVNLNKTHCGPDCPKGFHNDITKDDLSCVSDCSQPCVNGICTDIETCTCDYGLVNLNLTHCGPKCSDGFYNDISSTNFTCISKCSEPCVNGNCTDFDTCTCNPGLVNLNRSHCGPDCPKGFHNDITVADLSCVSDCSQPCINGLCTGIETCTCGSGLVLLNKTHCGPECKNGFHNDLSVSSLTCVSDCSQPCVNGICTSLETCTCDSDLVPLNNTHCGPECPKGSHNDLSVSSLACVSDCSQPCVNSICTDIETCTCDTGLVPLNKTHCGPECTRGFHNDLSVSSLTCVSDCSQPCVNGMCTGLETCTCNSDLVPLNNTHCGPECPKGSHNDLSVSSLACVSDCSQPCVNGICTDIETCLCDTGLVPFNNTHCGPECPKGSHNDLSVSSLACVSDCSQPCVNGICTDIETCLCDTGLVPFNNTHCGPECPKGSHNDLSVSSLACVSDCSQPCVNGMCTSLETCTCNSDLVPLNKTHCGPECPKGSHNDLSVSSLACVSECSQPCVNGICTDIETCLCDTGLVPLNKTHCGPECTRGFHNDLSVSSLTCVSDCSQPCVNGICTSLETCTCDSDLVPLNNTHCGPECAKGSHNDLSVSSLACVSDCSQPCVNSICTDIETCICDTGLVPLNKTHCGPECPKGSHNDLSVSSLTCVSDCSQPCVNGMCTGLETCICISDLVPLNNTHCGPECPKGSHNDLSVSSLACVSDCSQPCVNSICTDIETCICDTGLVPLNKTHCGPECTRGFHNDLSFSSLTCVSDCSQPCVNGMCTSLETCTCDSDLVPLNNTHCVPECPLGFHNDLSVASLPCVSDCSQPCVNAICTGVDICSCNPDLHRHNKTHCGPKCPVGFHNNLSVASLTCVSDCKQPCVNGFCKSIDTCSCFPDYIPLNETHCIPQCPIGFDNDRSKSDFPCKSKCSRPCSNGTCIDFDKCMCNPGYRPKGTNKFECEPICTNCKNGVCDAPNKCSCKKGYAKIDDLCEPQCFESCDNGYCSAPNRCECNAGYFYNETAKSCEAVCKSLCINSTCVSPDKCKCWTGYVSSNVSNVCKPHCSFCNHGDCIGPNLCQCNDGYKLHNNSCEQHHNEALSASYSWVPVCIVVIILAVALVAIFGRMHLMKICKQDNGDNMRDSGGVSSNELNMGQLYECKYKSNRGGDLETSINNTQLARASSLDYIEKL